MRFELREVDLDQFIVVLLWVSEHLGIGTQVHHDFACSIGHLFPACLFQVSGRFFVEREDGSGSTHFGTHITNSSFSGSRKRFSTVPEIFDHGIRPSLYGKNTRHLQDHIFGCAPPG